MRCALAHLAWFGSATFKDATLLEYNVAGSLTFPPLAKHNRIRPQVPDDCPGGPVVHMGTCPCSFDLEPGP